MTTPVVAVDGVAFLKKETTFGQYVAFVAGDAISFNSIKITPERNFVEKKGHTGSASLQGWTAGKYGGKVSIEVEPKLNAAGTLPEQEMLLTLATRRCPQITILAYANGEDDTVTVTVDGSATVLTEADSPTTNQFNAATSNNQTATNLAAAITSYVSGVTASASGAIVTIIPTQSQYVTVACSDATFAAQQSWSWRAMASGAPASAQLAVKLDNGLFIQCQGLVCTKLDIEGEGGAVTLMKAECECAEISEMRGTPTVSGVQTSSTISLTTGHAKAFRVADTTSNLLVQFSELGNNSSVGWKVTAVNYTNDTITLSTSAGATTNLEEVQPFLPTPTHDGTEIQNIASSLSYASTSIGFIKFAVSIATGHHLLNKEATGAKATRAARGQRRVTGSSSFYLLDQNQRLVADSWEGTSLALIARFGPDTSGSRLKVTIPAARVDVHAIELPDADEATFEASWAAKQSAAADDEFQIDVD